MKKIILVLTLGIFLSGCGKIFLPYEEYPLCSKGKEGGKCGSISEIYQEEEGGNR